MGEEEGVPTVQCEEPPAAGAERSGDDAEITQRTDLETHLITPSLPSPSLGPVKPDLCPARAPPLDPLARQPPRRMDVVLGLRFGLLRTWPRGLGYGFRIHVGSFRIPA